MPIDTAALSGSWVHSHEEDSAGQNVYRPQSFKFPPSRGRSGFDLEPDGTLLEHGPDATDRTASRPGTWELRADHHLALTPAGAAAPSRLLKVVAVSPDRLVLQKQG